MAEQLKTSIVRIRDSNGAVVGARFLVTERHVFTCAHVVASALDIADTTLDTLQAEVHLDFPLLAPGHILAARVVFWQPPGTDGGGDIAGLELNGNLPFGAAPARLASAGDRWGHRFRALDFPDGHPDGVYASGVLRGRQATGWIQVEDVKETGYRVEPGFSGTPVWDERLKGVVGMAVAAGTRPEVRVAFTIPADVLTSAWPIEEICYLQKLIAELEQRIGMYATLLLRHWGRSVIPSLC